MLRQFGFYGGTYQLIVICATRTHNSASWTDYPGVPPSHSYAVAIWPYTIGKKHMHTIFVSPHLSGGHQVRIVAAIPGEAAAVRARQSNIPR